MHVGGSGIPGGLHGLVAVIQRVITTLGSNLRNAPVAVESVPPERTVIVPVLRGRICEL